MSDESGYKVVGSRKARIAENACATSDGNKPWAVFKHTFYLGRWYYDGYSPYTTRAEAEEARDKWLNNA